MRFETEIPTYHKIEPASVEKIDIEVIHDDDMEETILLELRKRLNEWKLKIMLPELSNRKNNAAIYEKTKLAKELSFDLAKRIIGEEGAEQFNEVANYILGPLGDVNGWSTDFTAKVRNIISTDLFEYPMTFNVDLINTFKNKNLPMFE